MMKKGENRPAGDGASERKTYKKALKRGTRYRSPGINAGVFIPLLILAVTICVCSIIIGTGAHLREDAPAASADTGALTAEILTTDGETEADVPEDSPSPTGAVYVQLAPEEVFCGELILVNGEHPYVFPQVAGDVSVYENKTVSYKVNNLSVTLAPDTIKAFNLLMDDFYALTGCRDVMVVSGYRTEEFQRQLYEDRVATDGEELAAMYVALPGHSEHHTGLAMDLSVYTDAGEGYALRGYEKCGWLVENFEDYGFILRYPEEKAAITGISYESWHYRYVGQPHALIMESFDICLEEYIEMLQTMDKNSAILYSADHEADGENMREVSLSEAAENTNSYAVYYVEADAAGNTAVPVPEGREYLVSGDNVGGFIVTLLPADEK